MIKQAGKSYYVNHIFDNKSLLMCKCLAEFLPGKNKSFMQRSNLRWHNRNQLQQKENSQHVQWIFHIGGELANKTTNYSF